MDDFASYFGGQGNGYGMGNGGGYGVGPSYMGGGYGMGNMGGYGVQPSYQGMPSQTMPQQQGQQPNRQFPTSSLMTAIPSVLSGFGMIGNQSGNNNINALGKNSSQLAGALSNTNNPLYQQMYGQNRQQNMQNLAQGIGAIQGENRMQSAMGRTPLFARGREGEDAFRTMAQGYQNADLQAANQTRGQIGQALQGSAMAGNQALGQRYANAGQNNSQLNSFNSIAQLLKGFGGV